ncbi:copper resistance protein CopC [Nitrosomonas sp.]
MDSKKNSITENSLGAIADNPNLLNLPQLEPDHYAVHYRVMSTDGHVIE